MEDTTQDALSLIGNQPTNTDPTTQDGNTSSTCTQIHTHSKDTLHAQLTDLTARASKAKQQKEKLHKDTTTVQSAVAARKAELEVAQSLAAEKQLQEATEWMEKTKVERYCALLL